MAPTNTAKTGTLSLGPYVAMVYLLAVPFWLAGINGRHLLGKPIPIDLRQRPRLSLRSEFRATDLSTHLFFRLHFSLGSFFYWLTGCFTLLLQCVSCLFQLVSGFFEPSGGQGKPFIERSPRVLIHHRTDQDTYWLFGVVVGDGVETSFLDVRLLKLLSLGTQLLGYLWVDRVRLLGEGWRSKAEC